MVLGWSAVLLDVGEEGGEEDGGVGEQGERRFVKHLQYLR
jgi:hypothetical protein